MRMSILHARIHAMDSHTLSPLPPRPARFMQSFQSPPQMRTSPSGPVKPERNSTLRRACSYTVPIAPLLKGTTSFRNERSPVSRRIASSAKVIHTAQSEKLLSQMRPPMKVRGA